MGVFVAFVLSSTLWAQTSPAGSTAKAVSVTPKDSGDEDNGQPFKPHWENEIQLSNSNQQAGQVSGTLAYTGTWEFNEAGDFLAGEVSTIRQKLEGAGSSIGTLTASGGLGLGFFSPRFPLAFRVGTAAGSRSTRTFPWASKYGTRFPGTFPPGAAWAATRDPFPNGTPPYSATPESTPPVGISPPAPPSCYGTGVPFP